MDVTGERYVSVTVTQRGRTNRDAVLGFIKDQYGVDAEYLWTRFPNYAVFRHQENRKWFAVVMDVPAKRLGLDGNAAIDVLNVKCGPIMAGSLRNTKGYLPAYHMNKGNWISILLDGSIPEEEVFGLLSLSYDLTEKQK
jgi:predicted DNA-binding protein (MmcQ/YjbR family)